MYNACKFIIVDDDVVSNKILELLIRKVYSGAKIMTFINPHGALDYLQDYYDNWKLDDETVLFLDIYMDKLSGWGFLEKFDILSDRVKLHTKIYVLSASINCRDINSAHENKYVVKYLTKPILSGDLHALATSS